MNSDVQIIEERPSHFYRLDDRHMIDLEGIRAIQFIPRYPVPCHEWEDPFSPVIEVGYSDGLSIVLRNVSETDYRELLKALTDREQMPSLVRN